MAELTVFLPFIVLAIITGVMVWRDPRRMRCAIMVALTLSNLFVTLTPFLDQWSAVFLPEELPYFSMGILVLGVLLVIEVALFLIWTGVTLLLREGVSIAHSLSLLLGIGIVFYLFAGVVAAVQENFVIVVFLFLLGFPLVFFGFTLFAYLLYSGLYGFWARRWAKPGEITVVLGSGLLGEKVPPLLARRLDLGLQMYEKALAVWPAPVLVVSGGKGSDEVVSEAEAMSRYVIEQGMPGGRGELVREDQSASTEENLRFTRSMMRQRDVSGPWMVVTSDFHAFRAAMEMSALKVKGNAVGASTVRYFWASAKLREFIAILASHPRWTVAMIVVSGMPLGIAALFALVNAFS